jgi:predicted HNH restriction endonuclease
VRQAKELAQSQGKPLRCACCGFDFEAMYGEVGQGYIEAHHIVPVSELPARGGQTRIEDLVLVCANCHRMLHRRRPWLGLTELRKLLRR